MISSVLLKFATCCLLGIVAEAGAAQHTPQWTPLEDKLRAALQEPGATAVRAFVKAGANVNARDVLGANALHVAVNIRGDIDVLKLLLESGADMHAVDNDGQTPLLLALRHAHYKNEGKGERLFQVTSLLLSRGASVKGAAGGGDVPLRAAMDPVNVPLIQLLLKHGAAVPDDGLDWAIGNEHTGLIRLFMERATPAMLAFQDPMGGTLLHRAAESNDTGFVMAWLLGKGFNVNALDNDRITPIGRAAFADNLAGMAYLQGAKAKLGMVSSDGQTALHLAAYGARFEVMQWLIARGLEVKARDKWARTPLAIALDTKPFAFHTQARKLELIALLGGVPGDVLRGRFSDHPLHAAVTRRDISTVERLLASGASPNLKDESGNTPLYWAILWSGKLLTTPVERAFAAELLPLLIRNGADTTMYTGADINQTYAQFASEMRIVDVLQRAKQRYAPR